LRITRAELRQADAAREAAGGSLVSDGGSRDGAAVSSAYVVLIINATAALPSKHYRPQICGSDGNPATPKRCSRPNRSGARSWIKRPRTVAAAFSMALALERSGNVWGLAFPGDWTDSSERAVVMKLDAAPETPPVAERMGHCCGRRRNLRHRQRKPTICGCSFSGKPDGSSLQLARRSRAWCRLPSRRFKRRAGSGLAGVGGAAAVVEQWEQKLRPTQGLVNEPRRPSKSFQSRSG